MGIQTAGEQKYYDFIEAQVKRIRTGMIVWGSLLAVALIGMFSDVLLGSLLAVAGAALAVLNLKSWRDLKEKLDVAEDKEEFFRQLVDPESFELKEEHIIITKDYVLLGKDKVSIYPLSTMEKVEVGLQGKEGKVLFLTDRQGQRHEILSCVKGDGKQEDFDRAYVTLSERFR